MKQHLLQSPLFKGLTEKDLEQLIPHLNGTERSYNRGDLLVMADDQVTHLLIIMKGNVRGEMVDAVGKTVQIEEMGPGKPLAPAFRFGQDNHYPVDLIANSAVTVYAVPRSGLLRCLQENAQVLQNYLTVISSRTQFLSRKLRFLHFQSLKGKLAHYILTLKQKQGENTVQLEHSQA